MNKKHIISIFNNKGGVGKTTLTFHLGYALAAMGKRVLFIDLDPQCNLTINCLKEETINEIWDTEDKFIDNSYDDEKKSISSNEFNLLSQSTRSIHFILKPTEEGIDDNPIQSKPYNLKNNLDIIPGRLTLHMFEEKIANRWNDLYKGDPLAIRTFSKIREVAQNYISQYNYDFVLIDTSPSLGILNKTIISTVDGFIIPCMPDSFSLYGIKNIGNSLTKWKSDLSVIYSLISSNKRKNMPENFVNFLGYTIYNAKKYNNPAARWNLVNAHLNYAKQIPKTIKKYIEESIQVQNADIDIEEPIGNDAIMYSHNTSISYVQKYKTPIWLLPDYKFDIEDDDEKRDKGLIRAPEYRATFEQYKLFATDLCKRTNQT